MPFAFGVKLVKTPVNNYSPLRGGPEAGKLVLPMVQ